MKPFDENLRRAASESRYLLQSGNRAYPIQVVTAGSRYIGVALRNEQEVAPGAQRCDIDCDERPRSANEQRHGDVRIEDYVAKRKDRQAIAGPF